METNRLRTRGTIAAEPRLRVECVVSGKGSLPGVCHHAGLQQRHGDVASEPGAVPNSGVHSRGGAKSVSAALALSDLARPTQPVETGPIQQYSS